MYLKARLYKGVYLAPGSESFQLLEDKKFKELDKLMAKLEEDKQKLEGTWKGKTSEAS